MKTKKENKDWEKKFKLLENHLIVLAQEQDEAMFVRKDTQESQELWQEQMNAIKDFLKAQKKEIIERIKILKSANTEDNMISVGNYSEFGSKSDGNTMTPNKEEIIKEFDERFGESKYRTTLKQFLLKAIKEAKCRTAEENGKFCELRLKKQRSEIIENLTTELHYCIENKEDYKRVKKYLVKQK